MLRNPFATEGAAFRFLLVTLVGLAAVTAAALLGGPLAGVLAWAIASLAAVALYTRAGRPRRLLRTAPAHVGPPQERRLLVLAQEPLPDSVVAEIGGRADRVLVVSAATAPSVRRWASDVDGAREQARQRVDTTVARMRSLHADVAGAVGDDDPLQAIEDALRTFGGDEIVVSTRADTGDRAVAALIRERFALPVTHVVS